MSKWKPDAKARRRIPIQRKKLAGVTISIQRCRTGPHVARVVIHRPDAGDGEAKRKIRHFETIEAAKAFAQLQEIEAQNGGARAAVIIGDTERRVIVDAATALKPYGKTVADAVAFFLSHLRATERSATVSAVLADLLKHKKSEKKSVRYLQDLKSRLERFEKDFGKRPVSDITPDEISQWMTGLNVEACTTNNYRRLLGVLFNFAADRGLCQGGVMKKTVKVKAVDAEPGILTVGECTALLLAADDTVRAGIAIAMFAGLRDAELRRLTWQGVDLEGGVIILAPSITKRAQRRTIHIRPNLAAWLAPLRQLAGPVLPQNWEITRAIDNARHAAGFRTYYRGGYLKEDMTNLRPWPQNALRHSYASYRLAMWPDAAALALEMGNSPAVILKHYRNAVRPAAADAFWNLSPDAAVRRNITTIPATELKTA